MAKISAQRPSGDVIIIPGLRELILRQPHLALMLGIPGCAFEEYLFSN
jgi:hypothetical protein